MAHQTGGGFLNFVRTKCWLFAGQREIKRQRYGEALQYFEKVLQTEPDSAFALAQAAFCLSRLGNNEEAIRTYDNALHAAPNYADVHAHLAEIHAEAQRSQESYDSLHRAFRMKPELQESPYWLASLGSVCLKLNRWEEARGAYEKVTASDGKNEDALLGLGISLGNLERWQEALNVFKKIVDLNAENGKAWHGVGWASARLGHDSEALIALQRSIQLEPENGAAQFELGDTYYKLQRFQEALGPIQESVRLTLPIARSDNSTTLLNLS